jgi:glycosyltransferase involved in cell wall biosynthesis
VKIGLDLTILERSCPTGVERAWRCLVRALLAREDVDRYVLYSRGPLDLAAEFEGALPRRAQPVALGGRERMSLWRETRLAPALRQDGVDLLHSPVAAIPLRTQVPRVATVHEIPWIRHPGIEGRGREIAHRLRVRAAATFAASIVVPSEATRADLVSLHEGASGKVRVVPHGVDPLFTRPRSGDGELLSGLGLAGLRFFLAVGAARPRKGMETLLAAYAAYREAGGDRHLAVTGPGKAPPGPPPGVRWLGWIEDPLLVAAYGGADALVYHSLNEGFGLPPLEAMAMGVPVVAAAAGSVPEVVGEAALLVPPGDGKALSEALRSVASEEPVRARLVEAGRRRAGEFTWERAADLVVEGWRGVVETARRKAAAASSKRA